MLKLSQQFVYALLPFNFCPTAYLLFIHFLTYVGICSYVPMSSYLCYAFLFKTDDFINTLFIGSLYLDF